VHNRMFVPTRIEVRGYGRRSIQVGTNVSAKKYDRCKTKCQDKK
jgi:hypothetical protein